MTAPLDPATQTGQLGAPSLAVDIQPDNSVGVFVLDVSELDGPDMLAWGSTDPGTWVNVVCDVMALNYRRGATRTQGVLTQTEAGTCTVVVSDSGRQFDPMNNADVIHTGTPLRVRAWGYDLDGQRWDAVLFAGEVDEVLVQYLKGEPPLVTITGLDLVGVMVGWESEGYPAPGVGAGESLLLRVNRACQEIGVPVAHITSDLSGYAATLLPTTLARPWQDVTAAAEAELGRVWVNTSNQFVVRTRNSALSGPIRGTLSDVHGEAPAGAHCCVQDAAVLFGVERLGNRVLAGRRALSGESGTPALVRLDDEVSQARYRVGTVDRRSLELQTDAQLGPWAEAVIVAHGRPALRVDAVTPSPSEDDLDSAVPAWQAVCQTDIGDRWRFLFRPELGPIVDRTLGVLGIELAATPEAWSVNWTTEEATQATGWFVLDVSQLDGPDLLAPAAVPVP